MDIPKIWEELEKIASSHSVTISYTGYAAEFDPLEATIYIPKKSKLTRVGIIYLLHELGHVTQTIGIYPVRGESCISAMRNNIIWLENDAWDNAWEIAAALDLHELRDEFLESRLRSITRYTKYLYSIYTKSEIKALYEGYLMFCVRHLGFDIEQFISKQNGGSQGDSGTPE